jgi:nitrate reductase assembly molybdenum cofactor insertion protein NarJ
MIGVIPKDITLEDAFDLSRQVEFFSVTRVVSTSAEYGRSILSILSKYSIECD